MHHDIPIQHEKSQLSTLFERLQKQPIVRVPPTQQHSERGGISWRRGGHCYVDIESIGNTLGWHQTDFFVLYQSKFGDDGGDNDEKG